MATGMGLGQARRSHGRELARIHRRRRSAARREARHPPSARPRAASAPRPRARHPPGDVLPVLRRSPSRARRTVRRVRRAVAVCDSSTGPLRLRRREAYLRQLQRALLQRRHARARSADDALRRTAHVAAASRAGRRPSHRWPARRARSATQGEGCREWHTGTLDPGRVPLFAEGVWNSPTSLAIARARSALFDLGGTHLNRRRVRAPRMPNRDGRRRFSGMGAARRRVRDRSDRSIVRNAGRRPIGGGLISDLRRFPER